MNKLDALVKKYKIEIEYKHGEPRFNLKNKHGSLVKVKSYKNVGVAINELYDELIGGNNE